MNYPPTGFRPAKTLSTAAVVCLALMCACEAVTFIMSMAEIIDPTRVISLGGQMNSPWLVVQGMVGLIQPMIYIATVIIFLVWLFRVYKNLDWLENAQRREFTAGWAVGWWFVPFANLVKPFQVMREVRFDSAPEVETEQTFLSASLRVAPTYMGVWWGMWLSSNIVANIASGFVRSIKDLSELSLVGSFFAVASGLSVVAGVLCIKVIRDITSRQDERFANLQIKHSYEPPPPPTFVSSTF